jgi:uncharacterized RDD family membrane protein YckC
MFCSKCGANVAESTAFCSACGQPMVGFSVGQAGGAAPSAPSGTTPGYAAPAQAGWQVPVASSSSASAGYAGFWLRLVAAIIDGIVLSIPMLPVFLLIFLGTFRNMQELQNIQDPTMLWTILGPKILLVLIITAIASWLYWALMESSGWQATLGKKALGLVVTDLQGNRISFGRASGRFFSGRGVSSIPYLGGLYFIVDCLCVAFTGRKQAIHDMIASTLVLRKL